MTEIPTAPPANFAQPWPEDTRAPLPKTGSEREILTAFLDWHRSTFELKCAGVPTERLSAKEILPSALNLHAVWRAERERAREIVAVAPSLEATGTHIPSGEPISLRRIMVAMIAEYARHNGHADLLRERIDGATGY